MNRVAGNTGATTPWGLRRGSVGGEQGLRGSLFLDDRLVDAPAHLTGAAATLRVLSAGPENVHRTARACPNGSVDVAISNGPADADIHRLAGRPFCALATYSQQEGKRHSQLGQGPRVGDIWGKTQ